MIIDLVALIVAIIALVCCIWQIMREEGLRPTSLPYCATAVIHETDTEIRFRVFWRLQGFDRLYRVIPVVSLNVKDPKGIGRDNSRIFWTSESGPIVIEATFDKETTEPCWTGLYWIDQSYFLGRPLARAVRFDPRERGKGKRLQYWKWGLFASWGLATSTAKRGKWVSRPCRLGKDRTELPPIVFPSSDTPF